MNETTVLWDAIKAGDEIPAITKQPSYMQLFMFSAITWNRHMIHYNTDYAHHDGLQNVAVHRALLGNYLAQLLTDWVGEAGRLSHIEWNVRASAQPGDILTCRGKVLEKNLMVDRKVVECDIRIENSEGRLIAPGKGVVTFF
jgi:hydroxyacyl-ACP dehydratase HTD2-like protein with hotdog domain